MSQENKVVPSFVRWGPAWVERCTHGSPWCLESIVTSWLRLHFHPLCRLPSKQKVSSPCPHLEEKTWGSRK